MRSEGTAMSTDATPEYKRARNQLTPGMESNSRIMVKMLVSPILWFAVFQGPHRRVTSG